MSTPEERALVAFIEDLVNVNYENFQEWKSDERIIQEAEREIHDPTD